MGGHPAHQPDRPLLDDEVCRAGVSVSRRYADLRRTTPASTRWGGIPVLPVASVGTLAVAVFAFTLLMTHVAALTGGLPAWEVLLGTIGVPIFFAALYFVSKAIRRRQGFDVDLVYTEIPPS